MDLGEEGHRGVQARLWDNLDVLDFETILVRIRATSSLQLDPPLLLKDSISLFMMTGGSKNEKIHL